MQQREDILLLLEQRLQNCRMFGSGEVDEGHFLNIFNLHH
jgi:hypothetical protein